MEVHPPFSRYRARFSKRPWRISSARARFIVERERLRSFAMVPMAYQLSPSLFARSWKVDQHLLGPGAQFRVIVDLVR